MIGLVGLDSGATTVRHAEHFLHEVLGDVLGERPDLIACTHLIRDEHPHVALSIAGGLSDAELAALPTEFGVAWHGERRGPAALAAGAAAALAEQDARTGGRAVVYPGVSSLRGSLPVRKLLAVSSIDEVVVIGGSPCTPDTVVHTRDFVRPEWKAGKLVLTTMPAAQGGIAPFEIPNPGGCFCDH